MTIFDIQQDLFEVFTELEENGGELTPELEEKLRVSQENFRTKIESYVNVVKGFENDITLIDAESKRLSNLKKSKQNHIARLKSIMADAITKYGTTTKSGGSCLDYGTGKVSVRNSVAININEHNFDGAIDEFFKRVQFLWFTKQLEDTEEISIVDFVNACKSHVNNDGEEDSIPITFDEVDNLDASITLNVPIRKLMSKDGLNLLKQLYRDSYAFKTKAAPSKTSIKDSLTNGKELDNIAKLQFNKVVTIR